MVVVAGISALLVVGVRESARANNVIVAIKLVVIVVFIVAAAPFVDDGALGDGRQSGGRISFRPISAPARSA